MFSRPLASCLLAGHRALGLGRGGLRIILLHDIPPVEEDAFRRLMDLIARRHGFADPHRVSEQMAGGDMPVLVTFDDGFRSNLKAARLLAADHGARAVLFVCPGLIDLPTGQARSQAVAANVFRGRRSADEVPDLLNWVELGELAAEGHVIGAHTLTHRHLPSLSIDEMRVEVVGSGDAIAQALGRPVDWFAYPFGSISDVSAAVLAAASGRYTWCRSGIRGLNRPGLSPLGLLAEHVNLAATTANQALALEGGLDFRYGAARRALAAMLP